MQAEEIRAAARRVLTREAAVVAGVAEQLDGNFAHITQLLLGCRGKVLVAGVGTSHAVAWRMAHLLSCCGTPALFIHPGDAIHGGAGAIAAGDVVVAISKGGETDEVNRVARIARERGAQVVALTESPGSTLAQLADGVLVVRAPADADPFGMIATGSSLMNCAVADSLCTVLLELKGYTRDQFGLTHPGGAVGKKLRSEAREGSQ